VLNDAPQHGDVWGSGPVAPRLINIGTTWRWQVTFMPRPFYFQGICPRYPFGRKLCGSQSRYGHCSEEKNTRPCCKPKL